MAACKGEESEESFSSWSTLKPKNLFGDKGDKDDEDEAEAVAKKEVDSLQVGGCVEFEDDDSNIKTLQGVRAFK